MKPLLIVDGYNVIGCWSEAERQQWSLDACRDRLLHLLQDYSGFADEEVVLVFDGWQSDRPTTTEEMWNGVQVVYTRHGETADSYIERLVAQTPRYRLVRVATSDGLEQSQVLATGAVRMTSRELLRELRQTKQQGMAGHQQQAGIQRSLLEARLPDKTRMLLEEMRRANMPEPPAPPKQPVKSQPVHAKQSPKPAAPKQQKAAGAPLPMPPTAKPAKAAGAPLPMPPTAKPAKASVARTIAPSATIRVKNVLSDPVLDKPVQQARKPTPRKKRR